MEQKKEYIAPEMEIVDMEYTRMLCDSDPTIGCPDDQPNCSWGEGGQQASLVMPVTLALVKI